MMPAAIPGATARIGKSQGYKGLVVRQEDFDGVAGMTSAWEPTPAEIVALMGGAKVHISVLGAQPPMMVSVGEIPNSEEDQA